MKSNFGLCPLSRVLACLWLLPLPALAGSEFVHPGLLQSREDLERIKSAVAAKQEPTFSGYEIFRANAASRADYKMKGPFEEVGRNPTIHQSDYDSDANAAYQCALMWCITGEHAYADKAMEIVNGWSAKLKRITGRDAVLMAGLGPFKMVNAAELLRYTDAGWSAADIQQAERSFREVVYPVIKDFAPFANGNWDTAAMKTTMAIAVFCDDRPMFERTVRYYEDGGGDGSLTHYIINDTGQCQESGRDQQHTQLGLAHLGDCCEIAWHQGLDLYGYDDNRLLKGFEYTAKYNLGEDVPFAETLDRTGKYHHLKISADGRGQLRAVYEEIYNHYVQRDGVAAPYTERAAERIRPEGAGAPGADHVGFGTLLFTRFATKGAAPAHGTPAAPAGIVANNLAGGIRLSWIAPIGAENYTIKRAGGVGDFQVIANKVTANNFTDTEVKAGEMYRYAISVANGSGESADSEPASICAGLPKGWSQLDAGNVAETGSAQFDGNQFTVEAGGKGFSGPKDEGHLAFLVLDGNGAVTARYVPQVSSQYSQFGVMMRETSNAASAEVSLLASPGSSGSAEAPIWRARLKSRSSSGAIVRDDGERNLSEPGVMYGRLTGPFWFRLERNGIVFRGSISYDGKSWTEVGSVVWHVGSRLMAGLVAASGIEGVSTTVKFDQVTVTDPPAGATRADVGRSIESPDGKIAVRFSLEPDGVPAYAVNYRSKPMILESRMGLLSDFTNGFQLVNASKDIHKGSWTQTFGERRKVPDNYHEMTVDLKQPSGAMLRIEFRVYDEGVAFRYVFPGDTNAVFHFAGEQSEFRFPENTFCWEEHSTEGEYQRVNVADVQPWCERPLTLEYASGAYACLAEAANEDYPRMLLSPLEGVRNGLVSALGGRTANTVELTQRQDASITLQGGGASPWRVLVIGDKPGDLLERNYLILDLNPPCALADTSWIKPGKVMRDTTLTTTNSKAIIDFAATGGLQYVCLDDRWYGSEDPNTGDATQVRVPNLDIPEIVRYGKEKGIGLLLYVDRRQIKKQRDILFPLYEKWGVAGVKIGFIDVGPQEETEWVTETIEKAAEHHLMLNIHDGYRTTGLIRTWPNLMTVEGIRGNEHFPTAEHNCTVPFTRYITGTADYTVCYYDKRIQTTHAHQLAMSVVSFSPLQWIFWYDKPSAYHGEPEVEFFKHVPTVWDDTKVINGEIGKFATIARKSGDDWFIGTINDHEARTLKIPLDSFLDRDKAYVAHVYADDDSVGTQTKVGVTTQPVSFRTVMEVPLKPAGGQAVWIERVAGY